MKRGSRKGLVNVVLVTVWLLAFATPTLAASGWVSPTEHEDPDSGWSDETNAYDESIETYALQESGWPHDYLELALTLPIWCNEVRLYASEWWMGQELPPDIDLDVYYDGTWHNILTNTSIDHLVWVELEIPGGLQLVSRARVRSSVLPVMRLYEFDFWEVETSSSRTLTQTLIWLIPTVFAIFGIVVLFVLRGKPIAIIIGGITIVIGVVVLANVAGTL